MSNPCSTSASAASSDAAEGCHADEAPVALPARPPAPQQSGVPGGSCRVLPPFPPVGTYTLMTDQRPSPGTGSPREELAAFAPGTRHLRRLQCGALGAYALLAHWALPRSGSARICASPTALLERAIQRGDDLGPRAEARHRICLGRRRIIPGLPHHRPGRVRVHLARGRPHRRDSSCSRSARQSAVGASRHVRAIGVPVSGRSRRRQAQRGRGSEPLMRSGWWRTVRA